LDPRIDEQNRKCPDFQKYSNLSQKIQGSSDSFINLNLLRLDLSEGD
jgi:hypothetical protein